MNLIWTDAASDDVDDIQLYIAQDNVSAALRMGDAIERAGRRLLDHPRLGRLGSLPSTRELVVPRTRYFLVYRVTDGVVEVLRVMGGGRAWPPGTPDR